MKNSDSSFDRYDKLHEVVKEISKFYKESFGVNETDGIVQLNIGCYSFEITVNKRMQYKMDISYHPATNRGTIVKNYIVADSIDCLIPYIKSCWLFDVDKSMLRGVKDWSSVLGEMLSGTPVGNHLEVQLRGSRGITIKKNKKGKFIVNVHTFNNSKVDFKYKCKTIDEVIVLVRAFSNSSEG